MKITEVHERKIILITGFLYMFFFVFTACYLLMAGDPSVKDTEDFLYILGIFFGIGASPLLCLYALWDYFRKRLVLFADYAVYFPLFGKKKTFYYDNIQTIQATRSGKYRIYSCHGEILASFHRDMSGTEQALHFLLWKGIIIVQAKPGALFLFLRHLH